MKNVSSGSLSKFKEVSNVSMLIYVINFPHNMGEKELWEICVKVETVVDVFISKKLSKLGKSFGFIRLLRVYYIDSIIQNLCNVCIGYHRLFTSRAKFTRNESKHLIHPKFNLKKFVVRGTSTSSQMVSYAQVLKGKSNPTRPDSVSREELMFFTSGDYIIDDNAKGMVLLAKAKLFETIPNLPNMCKGEGFLDVRFHYVGGM